MATVRQFKAVRPKAEYASDVAALPYDVMSSAEARQMVQGKPYSFLHVDRGEIDLPVETDIHSVEVYEKAASNLKDLINKDILIKDEKDFFYIYRLTFRGVSQTGLVACTDVDEYINGTIKKHEFTRADKEQDRINHVEFCDANTGPIFLAYKDTDKANSLIMNWADKYPPVYDFVAEDRVTHQVWVVDDQKTSKEITEAFKEIENLYIADGHHRNASAVAVALKKREENPNYTGAEEFNYYLSVIFPASQLKIMAYNRIVKDLNGLSSTEFIEKITQNFYILPYSGTSVQFSPAMQHQFGMYLERKWYILTADPESIPNDVVGSLDVAILQNFILTPILGIIDPRTDQRIDFIGGIRGLGELEKRVILGEGAVAFSMFPTSMEELMEVADSGNVMPPKSTWFEPKLRSGLFVHELKD